MRKFLILSVVILSVLSIVTPSFAQTSIEGRSDHKAKVFENRDENGDGYISQDEFIQHAKVRFEKMDMDGDGKISKDEVHQSCEFMREKRKEGRAKRAVQ